MLMPVLETERLRIRPFVMDDLHAVQHILNAAFHDDATLAARTEWLRWTVLNYVQLAQLHQPPYGDRGIVLTASGQLIGAIGFVPSFNLFGRLPSFYVNAETAQYMTPEFGLFWGVDPLYQRNGYATEAARAMSAHAFTQLRVRRLVATTEYDNLASQGVMQKIGMRLERNPLPEPPWFQVVGVRDHPNL